MRAIFQHLAKFRIPTLLGLGLILTGIIAGVFLVLKDQPFFAKADLNTKPEPIVSNVLSDSVTISFLTDAPLPAFVTFGVTSAREQNVRDDKDTDTPPAPRQIHYFTLKNLESETNYQYKINVGGYISDALPFKTAKKESLQNGFNPVIGTVSFNKAPLNQGLVYLAISDADIQSALITNNGNFLIPLTFMRKLDLSDVYIPENPTSAKLTISSPQGQSTILFKIKPSDNTLVDVIELGDTTDVTENLSTPKPSPIPGNFDLNGDGFINTADNAILLKNFGKNPENKNADLDRDGDVDGEDLKLMSAQINR